MPQARDRGAGLVSVVVVLAVAGILLSGALWLANAHNQSVARSQMEKSETAELELCAKLICMALDKGGISCLTDLMQEGSPLVSFYTADQISLEESGDTAVWIHSDPFWIVLKDEEHAFPGHLTILLREQKIGEERCRALYAFEKVDDVYTFLTYIPPETEEDA